ncbi:hypothetical protein JKY72_02825 [Candidatus Gracilibacteria bacterium]|nr:hypothetical protein [Candidatus Gracilibacteria bacterium]
MSEVQFHFDQGEKSDRGKTIIVALLALVVIGLSSFLFFQNKTEKPSPQTQTTPIQTEVIKENSTKELNNLIETLDQTYSEPQEIYEKALLEEVPTRTR